MNDTLLNSPKGAALPERVVTNWRRFSSGLWRVPEGDISAAYSAEIFPKVRVFTHEGRVYTNCGGCFCGAFEAEMDCYRLIPADEYRGPEPRQSAYEGREAACKGRVFRLGPKVVFVASDPTIEEWRQLIRVLYTDGGMFAFRCTYPDFLDQRFCPKSPNGQTARLKELAECGAGLMPVTQGAMRLLLAGGAVGKTEQMDFTL